MYACVPHVCPLPVGLPELELQLYAILWMLGIESGPSAKAAGVLAAKLSLQRHLGY